MLTKAIFFFLFLKRELVSCLDTSKVLLIKTKWLLHYVWDFVGKEERAVFINVFDWRQDFKVASQVQSIYLVLRGGPFWGLIRLASGPAGANRDDPCNGNSCFLHWISFLSNLWHIRIGVGGIWIIIFIVPQTSTLNHSFFLFFFP